MGEYKSGIVIPIPILQKNMKFSRREQTAVVSAMLLHINLPLLRANNVYVKIRNFGIVSTHGNRKKGHIKRMEKYNKKTWAKKKLELEFSEKRLLY